MANDVVVGAYLERTGGLVMRALAYGPANGFKDIEPTDIQEFFWEPTDTEGARAQLHEMARVSVNLGGADLAALAIASYGPFVSLRRTNLENKFGVIQAEGSAPPLGGLNLRDIFYREIIEKNANRSARMTIHTDAEACAIGEALIRRTGERELLIYLLCGEGIGMGVVQGRRPLSSALHSELGMLHVAYAQNDSLAIDKNTISEIDGYTLTLSEVASNKALRQRYAIQNKLNVTEVTNYHVAGDDDSTNLDLQAYYLAQACLTCTVTYAPHHIVIGSDLESHRELKPIADRINSKFQEMLEARRQRGQAVFSYGELDADKYITPPSIIPFNNGPTSFRMTGALGISYAAANSAYGVRHPMPLTVTQRK